MTHLRIEQNNIQENVSSAVIEKLYELAISGDLDQNSNLAGVVSIPGGYVIWKNTLETMFPDFHLTMGKEYIPFNDPAFEAACVANFSSDGIGMTMADFQAVTDSSPFTVFNGNSSITDMSELRYFINATGDIAQSIDEWRMYNLQNVTTIIFPDQITGMYNKSAYDSSTGSSQYRGWLYQCPNLQNIHFPNNITYMSFWGSLSILDLTNTKLTSFSKQNDSNVIEIYLPGTMTELYTTAFQGSSSLKKVVVQEGTQSFRILDAQGYDSMFRGCSGVTLDLPSNTTQLHRLMFQQGGISTFILRASVPPSVIDEDGQSSTTYFGWGSEIDLYVPDASLSDYSSHVQFGLFKTVNGISQLPASYNPIPPSQRQS